MFITTLRDNISTALNTLGVPAVAFSIEYPTATEHGDYSTNVAMVAAKIVGKNPKELAEELIPLLLQQLHGIVPRITIAGPGFINFHEVDFSAFSEEFLSLQHHPDVYGKSSRHTGERILIEHSSPNLFKPFHIGHLMNNAIGESIRRMAEYSSAKEVKSISFPSDVSLGIAKAVACVVLDSRENNGVAKFVSMESSAAQLSYLGEAYARGSQRFDADPDFANFVREVSEQLFEQTEGEIFSIYKAGKTINLEYFVETTTRLGSTFDAYIYESEAGKVGEQLVLQHMSDVFTKSNGAVIYEGEKDGLHTRVFINTEGRGTYESKDLGLLSLKFERYHPDISLFVTDHEQKPYFEVVGAAAGKICPEWREKTIHRTHGRMTFKGQKMSSRLGGVPLASDIINSLRDEVLIRAPLLGKDAEAIAIAAVKFSILRATPGKNINFDPETSLSFEGDSGPYLQYTAVRTRSVLTKAGDQGFSPAYDRPEGVVSPLEKALVRFGDVIDIAIAEWSPHYVATYLLFLAQAYNSWYGANKIIDEENPRMPYNLALCEMTEHVLKKGLWILGIEVPEKM